MKKYYPRIADTILEKKLRSKGAVLVEGPKWCGKSTTCEQQAKSAVYMQDTETREQNIALAYTSPRTFLNQEPPFLIDEWQEAPILWDAIRYEIDKRDEFGQFILTGSVTPLTEQAKKEIKHAGIGRITRMKMNTMSLSESNDSNGTVSLSELFKGMPIAATCGNTLQDYAFILCRGGWPKAIGLEEDIALEQAKDYYEQLINVDFSKAVNGDYSKIKLERLLKSYARNLSTPASKALLLRDIKTGNDDSFNEKTLDKYLNALNDLFVIKDIEAWNPNIRSKAKIQNSPIRHFCDPSIATASLRIGPKDLINDLKTFGLFFESMCVRDLSVYSERLDGDVFHYRDSNGLEADAVIHLKDGRYGLIEIKLGRSDDIEEAAKHLKKLAGLIDTQYMNPPSFLLVITAKNTAYKRADGVYVVPLGCLTF